MIFDLNDARWTQRQLVVAGVADTKTIDNYITHGHANVSRIQGRRLFTAMQAIEIALIAKVASIFSLPPSTGKVIVRNALAGAAWLQSDAKLGRGKLDGKKWIAQSSERQQVYCCQNDKGELVVSLKESEPEAVAMIFPFQIFARAILVGLEKSMKAN